MSVALVGAALVIAASRDVADRRLPLTRERAQAAAIDAQVPDCARIGVAGLGERTPGLLPPLAVLTGTTAVDVRGRTRARGRQRRAGADGR